MRRSKRLYRIIALILAGLMVIGMVPLTAFAKGDEAEELKAEISSEADGTLVIPVKEKIEIGSVEDLLAFAEGSRIADYSSHRLVDLTADLDLSNLPQGKTFDGIISFSGTFNGNGHVISGLKMTKGSETMGLFLYIEEGALVRDLTVQGTIECSDSKNKVGGIAGINAGTIRNCTFQGVVTGVGVTGGIAGVNGLYGTISRCTVSGSVNSAHTVGGVAGENCGAITDCINEASVNGGTDWMELEDDTQTSLSPSGILWTVQEEVEDGSDFGGIAGWSDGVIAGCENRGVVGYSHAGRNVGGIVGRQSGDVLLCTNSGKVLGKQDVGGIVGQNEPKLTYEAVDTLGKEVDKLHDLMNRMIDDMEAMGDDLHADFGDLNHETSAAGDTADELMDEMRDVVKKNVDVINELSRRIDYAMKHFAIVTTYLTNALDMVDVILDDLDRVREDLSIGDQMEEDDYDEAKERRLVLQAGQGGHLETDNVNPAEGVEVTIRIKPETGYRLAALTYTPYGKTGVDVTREVTGDKYVIASMPEENLTIAAVFEYVGGQYVVESNEGGRANLSTEGSSLKLEPADGYLVTSVTLEDGANLYAGGDEVQLPAAVPGRVNKVLVTFEKISGAHRVDVVTGTGGSVTADPQVAEPGQIVTLHFTAANGYELDGDTFGVKDGMGNPVPYQTGLSYSFAMPDSDVTVEAGYKFTPSADTGVYAVSNVGGNVTVFTNPTTRKTNVVMNCADGYEVEKMVVTDSAAPANVYVISADEMTKNDSTGVYTYELSASTLTNPVKVEVTFVKQSRVYYSVQTVTGTGGSVAADKASVTAGDVLKIAVMNEAHYGLKQLMVGGMDVTDQVEDNHLEYTVPAGINSSLEITAQYQPVMLILKSDTVGGSGAYAVAGEDAVLTISPATGYQLAGIQITDEAGKTIPCRKEYADEDIYKIKVGDLMGAPAYVVMDFQKLNNKETVDHAKDHLENETDNVVDGVNNISDTSNAIKELLTDEYGNAKAPEDLTEDELEELADYMLDLLGYVSDTSVAAGGMLGNANTIIKVTGPYADEALENVDRDLEQLSGDARKMNDSLQGASKELQSILNYLNALENLQAVGFSEKFDKNSDQLKEQLDTISDLLDRLDKHTNWHSEKLEDDMRAVNDQLNVVFDLIIDRLDTLEGVANGEDIVEDCSADEGEKSKIEYCTNVGIVKGDANVGGILGTSGVEKKNADDTAKISVGSKYSARALINGCKNKGFITVKNQNAGGIAGNLEVGYLTDCLGSGRVRSDAGNCLGGIAGISTGTIEACSSMAVLEGNLYVGGIAGQADIIRNSYSMASVLTAEGWIGAIAGLDRVESEDEDITQLRSTVKDRISGNYYVSSKLYGINGVSYLGVTEPLTYEELMSRENVPGEFGNFLITFLDEEEKVVQIREIKYGEDLTGLQYPEIATMENDYMEWVGFDGNLVEGNVILQAVSTMNVTILSSEKGESGKPLVLAEGTFTEEAVICTEEYKGALPENLPEGTIFHAYQVQLKNVKLGDGDVTRVRLYRPEEGNAIIYRLENGQWKKLPSKTIGSYEEVEMTGQEAVFCVACVKKDYKMLWICLAAGGVVIVGALGTVAVRARKKRGGKSGKNMSE